VKSLRIAIITDNLTAASLAFEARTYALSPWNYRFKLRYWRPDFLFVESAWLGHRNAWRYRIASYPDNPDRNNRMLVGLLQYARGLGIPTVFWNKEDGAHFDRFIDSARYFDHIFTVDENTIPKYRAHLGNEASVHSLLFPVQPRFHHFTGFDAKIKQACFVGSYSSHIHEVRRARQHMLFQAASDSIGLTVFDRNSNRKSKNYRYPDYPNLIVENAISYPNTAKIYRSYLASLNVNTIEDSPTMYSRRLIEIIACGGLAVTTPAKSIDRYFKNYCHVVHSEEEARDLLLRLKHGLTADDLEMARAGATYVQQNHTWAHRLEQIRGVLKI